MGSLCRGSRRCAALRAATVAGGRNWRRRTASPCIRARSKARPIRRCARAASVCATLPQLVAFVEDVAAFEQWIPDTAEARLIERPTPRTQIYYIRTSMPWPVKDRDMIYRLSETADSSLTRHDLGRYRGFAGLSAGRSARRADEARLRSLELRSVRRASRASISTCTSNPAAACRSGSRGSASSGRRPRC